jgi:hypothetical protein
LRAGWSLGLMARPRAAAIGLAGALLQHRCDEFVEIAAGKGAI